jgi:hypothetical protein
VLPLAASITTDQGLKMTLLRVTLSVESYYPFMGTSIADYNYDDMDEEAAW